ncbi:hypothetical protein [Nocardioides limicola]|uniref:hypothetical protein n=1 Tax=Nocardioides limicola TaxID=2803368 RepID=UPI00193BF7FD|nr:hypothetical protein [Nocardioides sp. DJM-14]
MTKRSGGRYRGEPADPYPSRSFLRDLWEEPRLPALVVLVCAGASIWSIWLVVEARTLMAAATASVVLLGVVLLAVSYTVYFRPRLLKGTWWEATATRRLCRVVLARAWMVIMAALIVGAFVVLGLDRLGLLHGRS